MAKKPKFAVYYRHYPEEELKMYLAYSYKQAQFILCRFKEKGFIVEHDIVRINASNSGLFTEHREEIRSKYKYCI